MRLQKCFANGVIGIHEEGEKKGQAYVLNARKCTMMREVFRHPDLKNLVRISRAREHYIFSIESTGVVEPHILLKDAIEILKDKCIVAMDDLQGLCYEVNANEE